MHSPATSSTSVTTLWQRAWVFSLVFHLLTTFILGLNLQQSRRGTAEQPRDSADIVLRMAAEDNNVEVEIVANISEPPAPIPQPQEVLLPPQPTELPVAVEIPRLPTELSGDIAAAERANALQGSDDGQRRSQNLRPGSIARASQTQVSVFGVTGTGTKFVYLFDRSASMEGAPLTAAKRQLVQSLESLESVHQFQIIFFNSLPHPIDITGVGRMAFATDQNKQLARNTIGNVTADLGTDRRLALKKAISFGPDVIFFLTDADDEMPPSELAEIERANGRVGAAICVIEFGRHTAPTRENFLMRLARQSGGQYGYVNTMMLSR